MRALLLTVLVACGGGSSDPNAPDQLVSCAGAWDAEFPGLTLSGQCAADCVAVIGKNTSSTCTIDDGNGGKIDCRMFGVVLDKGGETFCCRIANPDMDQDFEIHRAECE